MAPLPRRGARFCGEELLRISRADDQRPSCSPATKRGASAFNPNGRDDQVEMNFGRLHVRRTKRGTPSVHPIQGDELRALRRLQREQPPGPYVFASERGGPIAPKSFHTLISRLGSAPVWPSRFTRTCCATVAAMHWRTPATIPGPSKPGWDTRTYSTQSVIRSWRQIGSRIFGGTDCLIEASINMGAEHDPHCSHRWIRRFDLRSLTRVRLPAWAGRS
jgi:hypothetical protein